jgi:flavin reductase (DIM6/NTAB) family NADH-FMN oxidoreductase RutF
MHLIPASGGSLRREIEMPLIEATGQFCVNILSAQQQHVCRALSSKAENKFETLSYRLSSSGLPVLDGIVAQIDCQLFAVHEAGDHYIVIGEVRALKVESTQAPLVFLQGRYGSFLPALNQN